MYRNPRTNNKVNLINPSLALGSTVHQVLEELSQLPVGNRFKNSLLDEYNRIWTFISGEKGGFGGNKEEQDYKNRGAMMLNRIMLHPGPLLQKAVKLVSPDDLPPRFVLSEDDGILLCGKIDWLEYMPTDDSVHIIDFKTGSHDEQENSLQLPIYMLLVKNCQKRKVNKISYWYLDKDNEPREMPLPDMEGARTKILSIAKEIKAMRETGFMVCPKGGCWACKPLENIVKGKAKFIGTSGYQDIFINIKEDQHPLRVVDDIPF